MIFVVGAIIGEHLRALQTKNILRMTIVVNNLITLHDDYYNLDKFCPRYYRETYPGGGYA